jgi:hypothetical protein
VFGALPFIYGTIVSSIIALIISVPLSLGIAIFLVEQAPKKIATPIAFMVELLAAIPSVVYGLWGIFVLAPFVRDYFGYVEIAFAKANNLPTALIRNKAGEFIEANLDNIAAAAAGSVAEMPEDMRVQITNADGENAYPISSYTYILVHKDQPDAAKGKALTDFLWWAIHDGEKFTKDLHYASLPDEVVKKAEAKINSMTGGGKPLRQ